MLQPASSYQQLVAGFRWNLPERFNIGIDIADRWARNQPDQVAILDLAEDGTITRTTYKQLAEESDRLASALRARGVRRGDRIALILPQRMETAVAHFASAKLGAIAVPLAERFGVDALAYRLADSGASTLITAANGLEKYRMIADQAPDIAVVVCVDGPDGSAEGYREIIGKAALPFIPESTGPDDPALMIYTSGTTGPAKGALHGHRVLLGHLPGVQMPHEFLPQPGDRLWTPADWAWAGGLLNIMLPGLYLGVPVVATQLARFEPEEAFALMERMEIANAFIPPTALRMLRSVHQPRQRYDLKLRTIGSGGESLGREAYEWGLEALGLRINEFYGQTECNLVLASCAAIGVNKPGAIGKAVPGHTVAIVDKEGRVCAPHEPGEIAVLRPDPVMFLGYWNRDDATRGKFVGDWMLTGDQGAMDEEGYIGFIGRDDDVITSSGYRIGPGEVEDCLLSHEAVALCAVVGKPDPLRTEIVKAFIVLNKGFTVSPELEKSIRDHVRTRLAAHEYPREMTFVDQLPLTTTGKVIRRLLREEN